MPIKKKLPQPKQLSSVNSKTNLRAAFLSCCHKATRRIHDPIVNIARAAGHLNPAGLGFAYLFASTGSVGQSSVGFDRLADYVCADRRGKAPYDGAEYAVVRSPEGDAVCAKFAELHNGAGAVICVSGLAAISTVIDAFGPRAIIAPENVYFPMRRYVEETGCAHIYSYPSNASAADVEKALNAAAKKFKAEETLIYLEAPSSGTFDIPDIAGIARLAKKKGVRTAMDNTWASHIRFTPLDYGIDIAIQATTKYEGGYGDTPSGVVIARTKKDSDILKRRLRISGQGAVSPQTCMRLLYRVASTEKRLNQHASAAQTLMQWFGKQPFVSRILSPTLASDPNHARFQEYFGKGNGLFTVIFDERIFAGNVNAFIDSLFLFRVAESWGGHVSLALPVHLKKSRRDLPAGTMFRFHAGLERPSDLIADLEQASRVFAGKNLRWRVRPSIAP